MQHHHEDHQQSAHMEERRRWRSVESAWGRDEAERDAELTRLENESIADLDVAGVADGLDAVAGAAEERTHHERRLGANPVERAERESLIRHGRNLQCASRTSAILQSRRNEKRVDFR